MLMLATSIIVSSAISTAFEPMNREIRYKLNEVLKNELPGVNDIIEFHRRGLINDNEFKTLLAKHGFNEDFAQKMLNATKTILSIIDIISLKRRGIISDNEYINMLKSQGVDESKILLYEKATEALPSVSDIIRFAVREAYSPDAVEKFGMDEDIPDRFLDEAKQLGLSEENARLYWRAHWELPSLTMGIEMFHRGIITRDELEMLMRAQDVMPFWRDRILQLTYNLPTRVDLRRMFRIGVVDEQYVYNTYRKMGYDDITAQNLTKFTIINESEDERQLSKSEIISAYKEGEINKDRAVELLRSLGYSNNAIEIIILLADNDIEKSKIKDNIEIIESNYISGLINEDELYDALSKLNISISRITKEYNRIKGIKNKGIKRLDKDEYIKMALNNVITVDELIIELKQLNYTDKDINRLIRLHKLVKSDGE